MADPKDMLGASEIEERFVDTPMELPEDPTLDLGPTFIEETKPERIEQDEIPPGYLGLQEFGKIKRVVGAGGSGGDAKMANIMGLADQLGVPPTWVADRYEELSNEVITRDRFSAVETAMTGGILAGMFTNPVTTALGIIGYETLPRVTNALIKYFEDGKFKIGDLGKKYSVAEQIPGEASNNEKALGELFDVLYGSIGAMGAGSAHRMWSRFTKDLIGEVKGPNSVFITPEAFKSIPFEEAWKFEGDLFSRLGISKADIASAVELGMPIEIPSHAVVYLADTPWWAAIKQSLHIDPYRRVLGVGPVGETPLIGAEGGIPAQQPTFQIVIPPNTLAFRNNNPGNLRFVGQAGAEPGEKGFARFESPMAGFVALVRQVELDQSRGYTLDQFMNKYAPPSENNTAAYVAQMEKWLGINRNDPISNVSAIELAKKLARYESNTGFTGDVTLPQGTGAAQRPERTPQTFTRQDLIGSLEEVQIPAEQKNTFIQLLDSMAETWAKTYNARPDDWYEHMFAGLKVQDESVLREFALKQVSAPLPVDTPEFREWFGDSKVVNEEGEPLTVYHGTADVFSQFEKGKGSPKDMGWMGRGFYFTNKPELANAYTLLKAGDARNVMPVYLSMRNPYKATIRDKERLMLAERRGEKFAASDWTDDLKSKGHDGVIIDFNMTDGTKEYVVFDPTQIKSIFNRGTFDPNDPNILKQTKETIVKGAAEILKDLRGIIHLFEKAGTPNYDISTLIEESFHILIQHLRGDDLRIMNDWLGAEPEAIPITDWTTDQQEQAARGFQAYLFEGKAPSSKLREVFAKIRRWLLDIYKSIKRLGVELTDEVRGVFDRLVSTAEERENNAVFRMRDEYEIGEPKERLLFQTETRTLDEYDKLMRDASSIALEKVRERKAKETQKRENRWAKQAREIAREDPVQAIKEEIVKRGGLNAAKLSEDYDADTLKALNSKRRGLVTKGGKLESDIIAADYGFESQDEMIQAILDGPTLAEAVESQVEYFREEYKAEAEADALEDMILMMDEEIKVLRELTASSTAKMQNVPAKGLKEVIRRNTGQIKVDEASMVHEHHALKASMEAASRAARVAYNAGKKEEALNQKVRQRAIAEKLRDKRLANIEFKKLLRDIEKFASDKKLPWDYRRQIQEQLSPFSFKRRSEAQESKWEEEIKGRLGAAPNEYETFDEWVTRLEEEGELVNIDPKARRLLDRLSKIPLNNLTIEDIRVIHGAIKHLHHLGTTKGKLLAAKQKRDLDAVAGLLGKHIVEKSRKVRELTDIIKPTGTEQTWVERLSDLIKTVDAEMIPPEYLIRMMDGGEDNGPFWMHFKLPVEEAFEVKMRMMKQIESAFTKAFGKVGEKKLKQWARQKYTMPGFPINLQLMTKQQMIMLVANSFHPDNLKALRSGYGITDDQIAQVRSMLTEDEMGLVKDLIEIWKIPKKALFDAHMTLTGSPLKEVEGVYFPLKFDPKLSDKMAEIETEKQASEFFKDFFPGINVKAGAAHERTGGKAAPLLQFKWIPERLQETAHYGTHAVVVRDLLKLLKHPSVKNAILRAYGKPYHDHLLQWLKRVANPRSPEPPLKFDKIIDWTRQAQVTYIMFWRLSTALQQPLALVNTAAEVGQIPVLKAMTSFMRHPRYWTDYINQRSENIANRSTSYDREIQETFASFDPANPDWYRKTVGVGQVLTAFTDGVVAKIGWLAAYQEAMVGNVKNIAALDEQMAIRHADSVVIRTQASGNPKDRSTIMNKTSPVYKAFVTFFFSYLNNFYGYLREQGMKLRNPHVAEYGWLDFLKAMFLTVVVGGMAQEVISKGPNTTLKDVFQAPLRYPLSTVPFMRDVVSVAFDGYDYRGGLVGNFVNEWKRFIGAFTMKTPNKEAKRIVASLRLIGRMTGLPPDQAILILENVANRRMRGPESFIYRERKKRPK